MSTINKAKYYKKTGTLSDNVLGKYSLVSLLLGILFFFIVCLSAPDNAPVLMMILAAIMLIMMVFRFGVLRERLYIPFLALTLYVIMDGASTFWALAPKFALREFLKVFIAFALAVIMLAVSPKNEEQTGRRIATILAVCATMGSLISIDMISTHILSNAVFGILGHFTEAYSNLVALGNSRINSMFVNPNPYAGFVAIGVLLSLGLANTASSRQARCADIVLLYISSLGFLLAFSMGGCIFIGIAFIVFLFLEKDRRIDLFFIMLETAVLVGISTGLIAATSFQNTEEIQIIPTASALLGAVALCLLDSFVVSKTAEKLKSFGKRVWIVISAIIVLLFSFIILAWNLTDGVTLAPGESIQRSIYPSGGEYTLDIQIDGQATAIVESQNRELTILHYKSRLYYGDATTASFTVPEDSKVVYVTLISPEGATVHSVSVGGIKVPLHYKLIPGFMANRLQGLWANQNAMMRLAHFEDGLKLFFRSPIIGLGMGSFENAIKSVQTFYYETKYAHNHYIQALLDTGIIGLALFLAVIVTNGITIWKAFKKHQLFAPMLGAAFVFMFGHATMEIDFCSNAFLPMAFGTFALTNLCCGDTIEKPKLSKTFRTVYIAAVAVMTLVYCFFITGNLMAKQHIKRDATMQGLVRCVELDRFEWADYALPYVINAMDENTNPYVRKQADIFAERLGKVNSNTIPIYLAEYYFRTDRAEDAIVMVEKYVHYLASDEKAWSLAFDVLEKYENPDSAIFRSGVLRIADWLDTWNANIDKNINLDEEALAFIARYRN